MQTIRFYAATMLIAVLLSAVSSCSDKEVEGDEENITATSGTVDEINANTDALRRLIVAQTEGGGAVSCVAASTSAYTVELDDGSTFTVRTGLSVLGNKVKYTTYYPCVSAAVVDGEYCWTVDGELIDMKVSGDNIPVVSIDGEGYWTVACGDVTVRTAKAESGTVRSVFDEVDLTDEAKVVFRLRGNLPSVELKRTAKEETLIQPTGTLRRQISPEQPAWLVHIDAWNNPDPQAIIDLVPEDIRPFVIFNIAFSTTTDDAGNFVKPADAYSTAKSWLRVCAENRVWAMVQPSSGGPCHWADCESYSDLQGSVFEELFQLFPNFLGFNYAEQGWGYGSDANYLRRLSHFACLMRLCHDYGGYLTVSFFNPSYGSANSGVAIIKRSADLADACRQYKDNFIVCEKFTQQHSFHEMESTSMGVFLSGFAGNYGIRFDECGWYSDTSNGVSGWNGDTTFPPAAGAIPVIEHMMLTGETVMDGPELVRRQCFAESGTADAGDGYTRRTWKRMEQFDNVSIDIFRKIIDGTIRILSRREVIDRTKVVVVNDISPTGATTFDPGYGAPASLFDGLYLMDEDGRQGDNRLWFKKTGRYPAIPTVAQLADDVAQSFQYKVNASLFQSAGSAWGDISRKQDQMNAIFPEEYTGEGIFAARHDNGWVVYNCHAEAKTAEIPLKYNSCDRIDLQLAKYSVAVVKERADGLDIYLTNYTADRSAVADKLTIHGATTRPTFSHTNRVSGNQCAVSEDWSGGVMTLTMSHNGAMDLHVSCQGAATDHLTAYTTSTIAQPSLPAAYDGTRQYEAEYFDYKNISKIQPNAAQTAGTLTGFCGMGYLEFGQSAKAAVRTVATVNAAGSYSVRIRYCAPSAAISTVALHVNGKELSTPIFAQTSTDTWQTISATALLNAGSNTIELKASSAPAGELYFDYVTVERVW